MPKIKMKTKSAGPNGVSKAGDIVDVSAKEAEQLISNGYAEKVLEKEEPQKPKKKGNSKKKEE